MKSTFVETENVKDFHAKWTALENRGAEEACLMLVDGEPGLGKTTALSHWAIETQSIYLRANAEWKSIWFLNDLLKAFRVQPQHSYEKRFAQVLEALLLRQNQHLALGRPFAVIIDEADHISRNRHLMETVRDFADIGDIPFILVGMGALRANLARFPQISSRVSQKCRFEKAGLEDVRRFVDGKCDVSVASDLVAFIHRVSGGFNREIKEALASIERFAKRNGIGSKERPVTIADMKGQSIVNDRASGEKILVPELA